MYNIRNIDDFWEIVLADFRKFKIYNDNYKYGDSLVSITFMVVLSAISGSCQGT